MYKIHSCRRTLKICTALKKIILNLSLKTLRGNQNTTISNITTTNQKMKISLQSNEKRGKITNKK